MRTITILAAAAFAAPLAQPAVAQEAAQPESASAEIVVEGRRIQRQQVQEFVETLTPSRIDGQLGRFHYPICPTVIGLSPGEGAKVVARLRQVAKASGAPVGGEKCEANMLIIAAKDKRTFIESIPRYAPGLVAGMSDKRIAALAQSPGPAASWQVVGMIDENGIEPETDPVTHIQSFSSTDGSRIRKMSQAHFARAVLVVERESLAGVSTRQFADFAAMRLLAPVDPLSYRHALSGNPGAKLPAPSILDLFNNGAAPADAPASVTWWDYAFLQALYDSTGTRSATLQRSEILGKMSRILTNSTTDKE